MQFIAFSAKNNFFSIFSSLIFRTSATIFWTSETIILLQVIDESFSVAFAVRINASWVFRAEIARIIYKRAIIIACAIWKDAGTLEWAFRAIISNDFGSIQTNTVGICTITACAWKKLSTFICKRSQSVIK